MLVARVAKDWPSAACSSQELVDRGQAPHTAIIGCADSRAPLETVFDAMPGDIFVLRNAGNTCTHAEGQGSGDGVGGRGGWVAFRAAVSSGSIVGRPPSRRGGGGGLKQSWLRLMLESVL